MKLIKDAIEFEIKSGYINWEKADKMLHAGLCTVDNKFTVMRDDTGEVKDMKTKDEMIILGNSLTGKAAYKFIKPRFRNGQLWCEGLQVGKCDAKGNPFFPNQAIAF